jgi:glycosyltransferase involved in cell wall biosynthesis
MKQLPRITVVTPSYNQAKYIAETIESVMTQDYPNLEHIVIDGGSTDGTLEILERYHHLTVVSEPDRGQADAINKGFQMSSGDILGFLNSDDTLLPGSLQRIAREINPAVGRYIVSGRCRFIDSQGAYTGIQHPCYFESSKRLLEIWKGHTLPQPSTFWAREVWEACGPIDINAYHPDYDLFCRFSRKYSFCTIEQVLATYRLHEDSKTMQLNEEERLRDAIATGRKYWGSPFTFLYWQLTFSLASYQFNRTGRGRNLLRQAQEQWRQKKIFKAILPGFAGWLLAPDVAFFVAIYPRLRTKLGGFFMKITNYWLSKRQISPLTLAHMERTEPWEDHWVGPVYEKRQEFGDGESEIVIQGWINLDFLTTQQVLSISIDGEEIGKIMLEKNGEFEYVLGFPLQLTPGQHTIQIKASSWFVVNNIYRDGDYRPLAWKLVDVHVR